MNGRSDDQNSDNYGLALSETQAKITMACLMAARPRASVHLLAVSKTFPAEAVLEFAKLGQRAFGENYLQEALEKQDNCMQLDPVLAPLLEWHFIGPIQSNKTRQIAESFSWVHGVEREKIARRLIEQRPEGLDPFNLCIQVNISGEASKSGCAPDQATALAIEIAQLIREAQQTRPRASIALRGLMCIPENAQNAASEQALRQPFSATRQLFESIRTELKRRYPEQASQFDTLSMGMSADLHPAILEGSTMVRVGSALFGQRIVNSNIRPSP
jgi:PLP dependent protein